MKHFIRKDIRLLTMINILIPVAGIILKGGCLMFMMDMRPRWIYGFFTFLFINLVSLNLAQNGQGESTDVFINSLPVSKVYIVGSRYMTLILYLIYILFVTMIGSFTRPYILGYMMLYRGVPMTIEDILSILGFSILFLSIFLPFQYYDKEKFESYNRGFIYILFIVPLIIYRFGNGILDDHIFDYILNLNTRVTLVILLFLSMVLYILSMYISIRIYRNREFN
ncbi:MAG: ABC-2 transporter permease [Tissierellaceae bacterium]